MIEKSQIFLCLKLLLRHSLKLIGTLHAQFIIWKKGEELYKRLDFIDNMELQIMVKQYSTDKYQIIRLLSEDKALDC